MRKCQAFSVSLCVCVFSFLYQQPVLVDVFCIPYIVYIYIYCMHTCSGQCAHARALGQLSFCGMLCAGAELAGLCFWPVLSRLTCGMSKSSLDRAAPSAENWNPSGYYQLLPPLLAAFDGPPTTGKGSLFFSGFRCQDEWNVGQTNTS